MHPIPYLFFQGTCADALAKYAQVFGSPAPEIMPFSDMPAEVKAHMPNVPDDAVMHGALKVGDGWIYASDDPSGESATMTGASVHLSFPTIQEATRVFAGLSDGGEVQMPLEPTFWAPAFGTCTDQFGIRWMISADPPADG